MSKKISDEQLSKWQARFNEVLAERDAELFDRAEGTFISLTGDAELFREWPELSPDEIPAAIDYLNAVTSVKNKTPLNYVDDPMAGRETYEGRWRQAFVRRVKQGDVTKLVQVLRKGYAQEIKWDEARVRTKRGLRDQPTGGNPSDEEKYLEIYWPNLAIEKLETMAETLGDSTYTDPVVESESYEGEWNNLAVGVEKADDGSGVITLSLAIAKYRLDSYTTWLTHRNDNVIYLWGYAKDEAQAVIDAWKAKGRAATMSRRENGTLVDIVLRERDFDPLHVASATSSWNCRYKEVTDYYFGVEDPTLYPLTTEPANGVSYDRQLRDNNDGSFDIIVITRNVQYRDIEFQASAVAGDSTVTTRQQLGLTTQTAEPVIETAGVVISQRVEVRDDCSKDVVTNKDTGTEQETTVKIISPAGSTTITEKTVQTSKLANPSSTKGHIKRVENRQSKYPLRYDTHNQDQQPTNQTARSFDVSKSGEVTKVLQTENATPLTKPGAVKGTIYRQESSPTEAGNDRTVEISEVPADQIAVSVDNSPSKTNTKTVHTENISDLATPAIVKGTITRQEATPTEAGNQRTVVQVEVPTDQESTSYDVSMASETTRELHTENNTPLTQPTATKGKIIRQTSQPTEAGNERTVEETVEPQDQVAVAVDNSPAFVITKTLHTENDTDLTEPAIVAGQITRQTAAPTEAGNQRTVEEVVIPTNQIAIGESHSAADDVTERIETEMSVIEYEAYDKEAGAGTIREIRVDPTEAGNVTMRDRVLTPKDQESTSTDVSMAAVGTKVIHTENNRPLTRPSQTKGTIVRQSATPTEAGNQRTVEETIQVYDQTATAYDVSKSVEVETVVHTENDTPLTKPTSTKGTVYRQNATPTEAGNDRTVEQEIIPQDQIETSYRQDAFSTTEIVFHSENDTALTLPTPEDGKIKENTNSPTEAGNTQTRETVKACIKKTTEFQAAFTDDATIVTTKVHNDDSIPVITDDPDVDTIIDGDVNDYNKYDYVKRVTTPRIPKSCATPVSWDVMGDPYWAMNTQYTAGKVAEAAYNTSISLWQKTFTHTISYHLTASDAATAIAGGNEGSRISKISNHLWQAHKVTWVANSSDTINFAAPKTTYTKTREVYDEA